MNLILFPFQVWNPSVRGAIECLAVCTRAGARGCWRWTRTLDGDLMRQSSRGLVYRLFLRGCSWDSGRDLVGRYGGSGGTGQRRPAPAADSPSGGVRDARGAQRQETGGCGRCSCRNTSAQRRVVSNRRFRAKIAAFPLSSADFRGTRLLSTLTSDAC
jgi:hypothetical protein